MSKKQKKPVGETREQALGRPTPTFVLELLLQVNAGQAKRIRGHLEAGRQLYNAVLSEGQRRLRRMRADPAWHEACAFPHARKQERTAAFRALREQYGFSAYSLHTYAKGARQTRLAEHLDAVLAQTLATRAYQALNRVCLGKARRVRFKSRGRDLDSIENKRNDTSLRFVLQQPEQGNDGYVMEGRSARRQHRLERPAGQVRTGSPHQICATHPAQGHQSTGTVGRCRGLPLLGATRAGRRAIPQAQASGRQGYHWRRSGASTIALVPHNAAASLSVFCEELAPNEKELRRLQRKMDRQRCTANPDNYDAQGRIKKQGQQKLHWKTSRGYEKTRRRKGTKERKLAAHRKSLHGKKVHEIVAVGRTILLEKLSYKAWQKQYGKSVGLRAPGMFVEMLRRTGAAHGRHPARSSHTYDQTLAILSWLRPVPEKTPRAAGSPVWLWNRAGATGSVFGVSGRLP